MGFLEQVQDLYPDLARAKEFCKRRAAQAGSSSSGLPNNLPSAAAACYLLPPKELVQLTKTYKMAQDNVHRLQDTFLEHLQRKRTPVTIFLANGVRLQGIVVGYDAFCVLLDCNGHQQIVYKHAVTTTVPAAAVDLQDKSGPVETIRAAKPALIVERRRSRFAR
jgi:host factor-I protein